MYEIETTTSVFLEQLICLAHYSDIAITKPKATHFGGYNL